MQVSNDSKGTKILKVQSLRSRKGIFEEGLNVLTSVISETRTRSLFATSAITYQSDQPTIYSPNDCAHPIRVAVSAGISSIITSKYQQPC